MASSKQPAPAGPNSKSAREADLVMGTNNSSIVSKRSVEQLYYPKPHFFRYFVKKPQRRSPVINRGYWLRMYAMAESVRRFMREPSDTPKFVLNLGCGFDPLPFMLLAEDRSLCRNTVFVDVDYEKLMVNKKSAIQRTEEIKGLLNNVEILHDDSPVQLRSDQYLAIGCDLKNLHKLDATLKAEVLPPRCSVLCLAEVSLTYMDVKSADAVVSWASKLSSDVQFALLEQFFPDGPDHPFASTMMKHFSKLQAPLHSINVYPSLGHQEQRFKVWGWAHAQARSLWDLWSDEEFLTSALRTSLDAVEAFDEWEEFALFASHYFLLTASTKKAASLPKVDQSKELNPDFNAASQFTVLAQCPPGSDQRRYGALVPDSKISLGHHGGLGRQSRLATTSLHAKSKEITEPDLPFPPRDVPPRMCHTVTTLKDGDCLLVGGRGSPSSALQDCWLRREEGWRPTDSLPVPRYRHCAVKVFVGHSTECVLVQGGKTSNGECLDSWIVWNNDGSGWTTVELKDRKPCARFGACVGSINGTSGVLLGGIGPDGTVLEDFWAWELHQRPDGSLVMDLADHTESLRSAAPLARYISRFGATIDRTAWGFAIVGGIMPRQTVPYDKEIMLLDSRKLLNRLNDTKPWTPDLVSSVGLGAGYSGPRPLLTGHVSCVLHPDQLLILGGGGVCFSFGTFWTEGTWLLKQADLDVGNTWAVISETAPLKSGPKPPLQDPNQAYVKADSIPAIPRVTVQTTSAFQQILANGKPVVIEGSDIGPCAELWTKEYLTDAVGTDRMVVVHEAQSENMNFQSKNFSYTNKPFGVFLDEIEKGGRQYLRSISAEQPSKLPADLAVDFPGLSNDFELPEELGLVTDSFHSSPLRISGPVTMWLHYDVMANVLCQIRGERRLILFPPGDVEHLHVPPGASGSTMDIFQGLQDGFVALVPHTSPQEALLRPGDVLFIPPLWLHTASSAGQVSVAVNVFFRSLSRGYATGRDVYGNRDLQAYEKARNDIQKIAKSFDGIPPDMERFYMLRLAQELRDNAER